MARIYAGELSRLDNGLVEAVKALSDDFWVFFEVTIERNIDVFVIRPNPHGASTLILTEVKRFSRPVTGGADGPWMSESEPGRWAEIPANGTDINPYWQAINAANAMREWLWNNQRLYLATTETRKSEDFKVWPDLLLLSPPGTTHRLPIRPPNGYGRWWYSMETWVEHVRIWSPKIGIPLTESELFALVQALRLKPLWNEYRPQAAATRTESPALADHLRRLETLLLRVEERLAGLDDRLARLERRFARAEVGETAMPTLPLLPPGNGVTAPAEQSPVEPASPPGAPDAPSARDLTAQETWALLEAVAEVRRQGKSRSLPVIVSEMNRLLGYSLKERQYNGFGRASVMIDQARAAGMIKYGPLSGPSPTIYLPDEVVPS